MTAGPWQLDGKVAIVTGGGRGIGRATAELLAQAGAAHGRFDILVNNAAMLRQAGHGLRALAEPEDVARTIVFLVSDLSRPATGANLEILSNA